MENMPFFSRLVTTSSNPLHSFGESFFQIEGTRWGKTFTVGDANVTQSRLNAGAVGRNVLRILGTITVIPALVALFSKLDHRSRYVTVNPETRESQKIGDVARSVGVLPESPPYEPLPVRKMPTALGNNYRWPSDHLPISGQVVFEHSSPLKFASYNVLKQDAMGYITNKNDQGLKGSDVTTLSQKEREERICSQIVEMINAGHDAIALQECSPSLLALIKKNLPKEFQITPGSGEGPCIYNAKRFKVDVKPATPYTNKNKYVNTFEFEDRKTGEKISLVNTHVEKGQANLLGDHIRKNLKDAPMLLLGDMNDTSDVIANNLGACDHSCVSGAMPTHINTRKELVGYDQVHLIAPKGKKPLEAQATTSPDVIFKPGSRFAKALHDVQNVLRTHV
ncbi:MAG: hypothetical protein JSS12_10070 [Verrucomicrobia bacterium]|nr:hypothetical protein [Verrucomicrobiota bacterium]